MEIATLWIKRKSFSSDTTPELLVAWDEYSIEENWQGWCDACDRELAAVGDDVEEFRFMSLHVDGAELQRMFERPRLSAKQVAELEDPRNL